jgi:transposase
MSPHDHVPTSQFTHADRRRLKRALFVAREVRLYRRLEALLFLAEGHSISETARRVRVQRTTGQRWQARYLNNDRSPAALADRPRQGRPRLARTLTPSRLAAALQRDPRAYGYGATSWTVPLLTRYVREHGHLALSPRTLRRRLHESGFRWKRPRYVYRGRAPHLGQKRGGYAAGCKPVSSRAISCSSSTGHF